MKFFVTVVAGVAEHGRIYLIAVDAADDRCAGVVDVPCPCLMFMEEVSEYENQETTSMNDLNHPIVTYSRKFAPQTT